MYRITVTYIDGEKETMIATEHHKKDDYLWLQLANSDTLVLISLLSTKSVRMHQLPKVTDTSGDWSGTKCDSTAYVSRGYPDI